MFLPDIESILHINIFIDFTCVSNISKNYLHKYQVYKQYIVAYIKANNNN